MIVFESDEDDYEQGKVSYTVVACDMCNDYAVTYCSRGGEMYFNKLKYNWEASQSWASGHGHYGLWEKSFHGCKNSICWRELPSHICHECQSRKYGWMLAIRDIAECFSYLHKLEKSIREKRNQNNGRPSDPASKLCKSCSARNNGHSAGGSVAQAGEEHHRIFVLRNENRDVQARRRTAVREVWRISNRQSFRLISKGAK